MADLMPQAATGELGAASHAALRWEATLLATQQAVLAEKKSRLLKRIVLVTVPIALVVLIGFLEPATRSKAARSAPGIIHHKQIEPPPPAPPLQGAHPAPAPAPAPPTAVAPKPAPTPAPVEPAPSPAGAAAPNLVEEWLPMVDSVKWVVVTVFGMLLLYNIARYAIAQKASMNVKTRLQALGEISIGIGGGSGGAVSPAE